MQFIVNIQAGGAIHLNEDFNLITRTILQAVNQPGPVSNSRQSGLGNLNKTLFLSPAKIKGFTWGVGPIFVFPAKTNDELGSNIFRAGLSAVMVSPNQGSYWPPRFQVALLFPEIIRACRNDQF